MNKDLKEFLENESDETYNASTYKNTSKTEKKTYQTYRHYIHLEKRIQSYLNNLAIRIIGIIKNLRKKSIQEFYMYLEKPKKEKQLIYIKIKIKA